MAKVILNGQALSIEVVLTHSLFNIWKLNSEPVEYTVFSNRRNGLSVVFRDEDAEQLAADLQAIRESLKTPDEVCAELEEKIAAFLTQQAQ